MQNNNIEGINELKEDGRVKVIDVILDGRVSESKELEFLCSIRGESRLLWIKRSQCKAGQLIQKYFDKKTRQSKMKNGHGILDDKPSTSADCRRSSKTIRQTDLNDSRDIECLTVKNKPTGLLYTFKNTINENTFDVPANQLTNPANKNCLNHALSFAFDQVFDAKLDFQNTGISLQTSHKQESFSADSIKDERKSIQNGVESFDYNHLNGNEGEDLKGLPQIRLFAIKNKIAGGGMGREEQYLDQEPTIIKRKRGRRPKSMYDPVNTKDSQSSIGSSISSQDESSNKLQRISDQGNRYNTSDNPPKKMHWKVKQMLERQNLSADRTEPPKLKKEAYTLSNPKKKMHWKVKQMIERQNNSTSMNESKSDISQTKKMHWKVKQKLERQTLSADRGESVSNTLQDHSLEATNSFKRLHWKTQQKLQNADLAESELTPTTQTIPTTPTTEPNAKPSVPRGRKRQNDTMTSEERRILSSIIDLPTTSSTTPSTPILPPKHRHQPDLNLKTTMSPMKKRGFLKSFGHQPSHNNSLFKLLKRNKRGRIPNAIKAMMNGNLSGEILSNQQEVARRARVEFLVEGPSTSKSTLKPTLSTPNSSQQSIKTSENPTSVEKRKPGRPRVEKP